jgi:MFS transporter, FSR family, fosmidomycin resistance protein
MKLLSAKPFFISAERRPALTASVFGAAHLIVDMATIGVLYTATRAGGFAADWVAVLILSYDYIAFATQPFIGYALDRLGLQNATAALGCAVAASGVWLAGISPVAAVVVAAVGNALFHAGGGAVCLRLDRSRAAWAGIFVAPGAIGLFLGKLLGGSALYLPWALTALLALCAAASLLLRLPRRPEAPALPKVKLFGLVAALLIVSVAVRSLVGFSVSYPWVAGWQQAVWLTAAAVAGKALGGVIGDKFCWRNVSVAGLVLSAPLLALGAGTPWMAVAGLVCFNLTMALTLAGLAYLLPGYEGFAFGLTAAAIVIGLTPSVVPGWAAVLGSPAALAGIILLSAAALWVALGRLEGGMKEIGKLNMIKGGMTDAH